MTYIELVSKLELVTPRTVVANKPWMAPAIRWNRELLAEGTVRLGYLVSWSEMTSKRAVYGAGARDLHRVAACGGIGGLLVLFDASRACDYHNLR